MVPICRTIKVVGFRSNRSRPFATAFQNELDDEKTGRGPGPTIHECLVFVGHVGVSTDAAITIYGFNPEATGVPVWQMLNDLKNGGRFPGVVRDDPAVFTAAQKQGLTFVSFEIISPDPRFRDFERRLLIEIT